LIGAVRSRWILRICRREEKVMDLSRTRENRGSSPESTHRRARQSGELLPVLAQVSYSRAFRRQCHGPFECPLLAFAPTQTAIPLFLHWPLTPDSRFVTPDSRLLMPSPLPSP